MSTGNDKSHSFGRNAAIASAIALSLFSTAAAPAAYAQEPVRATPITATMQANANVENDNAIGRAMRASKGLGRIGVFVETSPNAEKILPAAGWGEVIQGGLERRGDAVHVEVRPGTSIHEHGRLGLFVNGKIAWSGSVTEFNSVAAKTLDTVDAAQEHHRQVAGLPINTHPTQTADLR